MNAITLTSSSTEAPRKSFRFGVLLTGIAFGIAATITLLSLNTEDDQVVRQSQSDIQSILPVLPQSHRLEYYRPDGRATLNLSVVAEGFFQREEVKRTRDVLEVALAEAGWITYRPNSRVKVGDAFFEMKQAEYDPARNELFVTVTIKEDGHRRIHGEYRFNTMAPGVGNPIANTAHAEEEPLGYRSGGDITNRAALPLQVIEKLRVRVDLPEKRNLW